MNSTHSITLEAEPKAEDINTIVQGLLSYNKLHTGGATPEYLVVTVRSDEGDVVGGLFGATEMGWLQVHALWLPDALRGNGYGSTLLAIAEEEARKRGCENACLETFSFQALAFYEKQGYMIYGQLTNFPTAGAKYYLAKSL